MGRKAAERRRRHHDHFQADDHFHLSLFLRESAPAPGPARPPALVCGNHHPATGPGHAPHTSHSAKLRSRRAEGGLPTTFMKEISISKSPKTSWRRPDRRTLAPGEPAPRPWQVF